MWSFVLSWVQITVRRCFTDAITWRLAAPYERNLSVIMTRKPASGCPQSLGCPIAQFASAVVVSGTTGPQVWFGV